MVSRKYIHGTGRAALFLALILSGYGFAQSEAPMTSQFHLKWKTPIGITTYRTNMLFHDGWLFIGSNGASREQKNDPQDGVYAIDPKTGAVKMRYKVPFAGDDDVTGISIADNKLFFGTDNYYFFCFDVKTGKERWKKPLPYDVESAPVNEDFNRDGVVDVAFSVQGFGFYALDGETGTEIWKQDSISSHDGNVASLLVDIDNDGVKDIVNAGRGLANSDAIDGFKMRHYGDYHFALNGRTGCMMWVLPSGAGIHSSPFLFEANGQQRIALLDCYGEFQVVDLRGNLLSHMGFGYSWFCSPVMTKDHHLVIGNLAMKYSDDVLQTDDYDGVPHPGDSTEANSVGVGDETISATTMIADVLGKGTMQAIGVTEQGTLFIMQTNGTLIRKYRLLGKGAEASPFIRDIDGDGRLEILIADLDGYLYCFGTNAKGKTEVGQFR